MSKSVRYAVIVVPLLVRFTHKLALRFRYPDEPSFILPQCLKDKVAAGDLGRKSGKGFYNWDGDKRGDPVA